MRGHLARHILFPEPGVGKDFLAAFDLGAQPRIVRHALSRLAPGIKNAGVIAGEMLAQPWVRCAGQFARQIHGDLAGPRDDARGIAGQKLVAGHLETLADRAFHIADGDDHGRPLWAPRKISATWRLRLSRMLSSRPISLSTASASAKERTTSIRTPAARNLGKIVR